MSEALPVWIHRLATLCDLPVSEVQQLRPLLEDASCWMLSEMPGVSIIRVPVGPRRRGAQAFVIRAQPGIQVPMHTHDGSEHIVVIAGALLEDSGRRIAAGDELVSDDGTSHSLVIEGPGECICGVVNMPVLKRKVA